MEAYPVSVGGMLRKPSAALALAISLTALGVVLWNVALFGIVRGGDEGAAAHLWQLLIAAQVPVILYLAVKWLPKATKPTLLVLGILAGTTAANLAAVFFLT